MHNSDYDPKRLHTIFASICFYKSSRFPQRGLGGSSDNIIVRKSCTKSAAAILVTSAWLKSPGQRRCKELEIGPYS